MQYFTITKELASFLILRAKDKNQRRKPNKLKCHKSFIAKTLKVLRDLKDRNTQKKGS